MSTPPAAARRRRLLPWLLGLPLLLLGLAAAGVGYLVHTPEGLQWLVRQAREFAPGRLEVQRVEGRLTGPLELHGLDYVQGDLSLHLGRLYLDWRPRALLSGGLELVRLEGEGMRLRLPAGDPAAPPAAPFPGLVLPLRVNLEAAEVTGLEVAVADAAPLVVERIALSAGGGGEALEVRRLELAGMGAELAADGTLGLGPGLPMALTLDWGYRLPDGPRLAGRGTVQGDLGRLQLHQTLAAPLAGSLEAVLEQLEQTPRWDARLHLERGEIAPFAAAFPALVSGELHSTGSPQDARLESALVLEEPGLGRVQADLQAAFDGAVLTARQLHLETPAGSRIEGSGSWRLADGLLDLALEWRALRWPLQGEPVAVGSERGRLEVGGRLQDYGYRLELALAAPDAPPVALEAEGRGNLEGLRLERVAADLLEGRLEGSGRLDWAPETDWALSLEGSGLNPEAVLAELPGRLALGAVTRGRLGGGGLEAELELKRLDGRLRDYPVQAAGGVRLRGDELALERIEVSTGDNRLNVSGTLGRSWDLAWTLDAPRLDGLWPGLAGRLEGEGRLAGSSEQPAVTARLQGRGLAYAGHRIARLDGNLGLEADGRIGLDLDATGLGSGDLRWNRLRLEAQGPRDAQTLRLVLAGVQQAPSVDLALSGALAGDDTWRGRIDALSLQAQGFGRWQLQRPSSLILGARQLAVEPACLDGPHAVLCIQAKGDPAGAWKARLHSEKLSLALLRPWLPEALGLEGGGRLALELAADAGGRIGGEGLLELPQGTAELALGEATQTLDLSGTRLQAILGGKGLEAALELPLGNLGAVQGGMELPGLALPALDPATQSLHGRLRADVSDLAFLSALVPALGDARGAVHGDFRLAGTLAAPELKGGAELSGGALDVPELGLQVRELEARVQAPDLKRLRFEATARSGKGRLKLAGETALEPDRGWPTEVRVSGSEWVAVDLPQATVQVSPDLTLHYRTDESRLDGELRVPFARLRPRQLPESAAADSPDLVVVQDGEPVEGQGDDSPLHARIRLVLGDRVSFEGFGLRGRFTGSLELIDEPGRPVLGNGALNIVEGTYRAYGQDLSIERGSALFADSPVDNPGLDLRAVREAGDVTAGIRVGGTLKKPDIGLFSTPSMTQSEILSYLLTGGPPGESGGGSATAALAGAAAGGLAGEVGRQLGLDELRLETGGDLSNASVVAGTWLSPRLYVQYVNDLAARQNKLRLKYDVNKRLQIQTETGDTQGLDLFYTIER